VEHGYKYKLLQSPQFNFIFFFFLVWLLVVYMWYMLHKVTGTVSSPRSTTAVNNRQILLHQIILVFESEFHKKIIIHCCFLQCGAGVAQWV
jgi:hypothetical protein